MKLFFANTSPYARKARMVIIEKDLEDRVEAVFQNPFEDSADLVKANPLKQVPTLVTDDGTSIFDSPVICAYLDALSSQKPLIPTGDEHWQVLTGEAMTDGILDAAFAIVMERRRPDEQQSAMWFERWESGIDRSMNAIESDLSVFKGHISIAQIGLGCALGYLDFRLPDLEWRPNRPSLSAWFEEFEKRPSMVKTEPPRS